MGNFLSQMHRLCWSVCCYICRNLYRFYRFYLSKLIKHFNTHDQYSLAIVKDLWSRVQPSQSRAQTSFSCFSTQNTGKSGLSTKLRVAMSAFFSLCHCAGKKKVLVHFQPFQLCASAPQQHPLLQPDLCRRHIKCNLHEKVGLSNFEAPC